LRLSFCLTGLLFAVIFQLGPNAPQEKTNKNKQLFNGLFSKTTWVSRHQKGKVSLDFNEARDDDIAVASAGPYANHLHYAADI